ncbi:MAG: hypothetical protein GVY29_07495, partial [Spirochaetes bacterium]|nr:hypothetical protein [Spirochaetota bacterium]
GGPDGGARNNRTPRHPEPQREHEATSRFEAIDRVDPHPVDERLAGTLGATALAIQGGADILRVHDVAETADLVTVMGAISHLSTEAGSSR